MAEHRTRQRIKALLRKLVGKSEKTAAPMTPIPISPPTPMTTPTAAQRVFGVAELLEHILVNLQVTPLAVARRVCRDWNGAILTTKSLRQISYLEPMDEAYYDTEAKHLSILQSNSLLASMHPAIAAFFLSNPYDWIPFFPRRPELILEFWLEEFEEWLERHSYLEKVLITASPFLCYRRIPTRVPGAWLPCNYGWSVLTAAQVYSNMSKTHLQRGISKPDTIMRLTGLTLDRHIYRAIRDRFSYDEWHTRNTGTTLYAAYDDPRAYDKVTPQERDLMQSPEIYQSGELKAIFEAHARLAAIEQASWELERETSKRLRLVAAPRAKWHHLCFRK